MSLIGNQNVFIGSNTSIQNFKNFILIFGLFGKFKLECNIALRVIQKNHLISFYPLVEYKKRKKFKSSWGTLKSLFYRSSYGAANKFQFFLKLVGVGFKVFKKNQKLILKLGLGHKKFMSLPLDSSYKIKKIQKRPLIFCFSGPDYELLKHTMFFLRSFKKPETYKGKGFSFNNELLILKEGKKVKN